MTRLTTLSGLRAPERAATLLLRGQQEAGGDPDMQAGFALLREQARALDLTILEGSARYLGPDEIELLSWLTLFQHNPSFAAEIAPPALADGLDDCARRLVRAGHKLHINATLRLKNPSAQSRVMIAAPHRGTMRAFLRLPPPASVQGRALRHVAALGTADTRGLAELGFSRQLISLMLQQGLVRRVGHGKYSVVPEVATALEKAGRPD